MMVNHMDFTDVRIVGMNLKSWLLFLRTKKQIRKRKQLNLNAHRGKRINEREKFMYCTYTTIIKEIHKHSNAERL